MRMHRTSSTDEGMMKKFPEPLQKWITVTMNNSYNNNNNNTFHTTPNQYLCHRRTTDKCSFHRAFAYGNGQVVGSFTVQSRGSVGDTLLEDCTTERTFTDEAFSHIIRRTSMSAIPSCPFCPSCPSCPSCDSRHRCSSNRSSNRRISPGTTWKSIASKSHDSGNKRTTVSYMMGRIGVVHVEGGVCTRGGCA